MVEGGGRGEIRSWVVGLGRGSSKKLRIIRVVNRMYREKTRRWNDNPWLVWERGNRATKIEKGGYAVEGVPGREQR